MSGILRKSAIPNDERTKKQLKDLWRRHLEFNGIIMSENQFCDRGDWSNKSHMPSMKRLSSYFIDYYSIVSIIIINNIIYTY